MTYSGASQSAEARQVLGEALGALQADPNIPQDVLSVAGNIAQAIGALFEAEKASSDLDGKASVKHALGSLSQTMALLQDVSSQHEGIDTATKALARVMQTLYPLAQAPTMRPPQASVPPRGVPSQAPAASAPPRSIAPGEREQVEANIGATTESNFFVGFSGEISEGGVFVATYLTAPRGTKVDVLVTLPGGFEKRIPGTVRFVRDPMDMESEPGLGVGFDRLDKEARELILRFIRKRPPLFFDD